MPTPIVLTILDGWGYATRKVGNPIQKAEKPAMNFIERNYPLVLLQASGLAVGLHWGEVGNSETGHLNLGAGRCVPQYQTRIEKSIRDGTFFSNPALVGAFTHAKESQSRVHLVGLLTSGSVHAHFEHIRALLDMCEQQQVPDCYLHVFTDGKDSGLQEGVELLQKLQKEISERATGTIATIIGRNSSMDRDNHWNLIETAYNLIANGAGQDTSDPSKALSDFYAQNIFDLNIPPLRVLNGYDGIHDNDSIIFFNFREDSIRQLYQSFAAPSFDKFPRKKINNSYLCSMTQYDPEISLPVAFTPPSITNNLAEVLSAQGLRQYHIAETVKYAHVTYFFNGLTAAPYPGERDELIPSVPNIEEMPTMRALDIAQKIKEQLETKQSDVIIANFANADMLAHTGNYDATLIGVETISQALQIVHDAALAAGGILLVTADHGNAESLTYKGTGEPESKHDDDPVPFYVVGAQYKKEKTDEDIKIETVDVKGILGDVAPTILELLGIPQPVEMTGRSLLSLL